MNALHERIQSRIQESPALDAGQREKMERNLERCLHLGMRDYQVEGLFPMPGEHGRMDPAQLLDMQERVLASADSGLPAGLLADKIREGRMKGVAPDVLAGVMQRLETHMSVAHREMGLAVAEGVTPTGNEKAERHLQRGLALDMWRGLHEEDLEQIREHASQRAMHMSCSTIDLAAAAETATELIEQGIEPARARDMVGMGLDQGYSAQEMRQIGQMAMNSTKHGAPPEETLRWMEHQMHNGAQTDEMMRQMMQHGWLGPRDMYGPGGCSPVDDVMGGPGHHYWDGHMGDGWDNHGGDGWDGHMNGDRPDGGMDGHNDQSGQDHSGGSSGGSSRR
jgi:hypothetical protein